MILTRTCPIAHGFHIRPPLFVSDVSMFSMLIAYALQGYMVRTYAGLVRSWFRSRLVGFSELSDERPLR